MSTRTEETDGGIGTARSEPRSSRPAVVILLLSASYIAITLNIQGFIGMMPLVQAEFTISGAQAGLYTSFYFMSATVIAIFAGRIVDRIGTRRGLVIGGAIVGAMMLLHALSPVYFVILLLAFVTGIGFSLITPSVSKGVMENVSSRRRAGAMGVAHGIGGSGALFGTALMPYFGQLYGWRTVLVVGGAFGLVVALVILRVYRRVAVAEPDPGATRASGAAGGSSLKQDLKELLKNRPLLVTCLLGSVFGIALSSISSHMALFLHQDLAYTPALAGLGVSAFHLGGVFGQPSWGLINDKVLGGRRHLGLLLLAGFSAALVFLVAGVATEGTLGFAAMLAISLTLGFCVMGMPSLFLTTISELSPAEHTGVATGIAVIFIRVGVVTAAPLFGLLSDLTGDYTLSWFALGTVLVLISLTVIALMRRYRI